MRSLSVLVTAVAVSLPLGGLAAEDFPAATQLHLPAQGTHIDLKSGIVSRNGFSNICLETVSRAGGNTLVVTKSPGDNTPTVTVNGKVRTFETAAAGVARLGAMRVSRDGALIRLRNWKSGDRQTELLQEDEVKLTWDRYTSVSLLRVSREAVFTLETGSNTPQRLVRYQRDESGDLQTEPEVLVDFKGCAADRLRLSRDTVWAKMACSGERGAGIYRIPLDTGAIGHPLLKDPAADFISLPRTETGTKGIPVALVSGTSAALHFHFAAKGLLGSQSGEVLACSSDAEGRQSWNQSYRLRALAAMYEKTGAEVFADLARKSIRLTLAAQDGSNGRDREATPGCGWSSKIYSKNGSQVSLMINQAVIANALTDGCENLGPLCPAKARTRIAETRQCLADFFEPAFDAKAGLYRIAKDTDFRFAGALAPWNWQVSFAAMLQKLPDAKHRARAEAIINQFRNEWTLDENGSLWRYWPETYYREKGLEPAAIAEERVEDTGHAGISLLSLQAFDNSRTGPDAAGLKKRTDFLLAAAPESPRDLDGGGPIATRWFLSGGWADYPTKRFLEAYAGAVPGSHSADSVYSYARLFDPRSDFRLSLDIFDCSDTCEIHQRHSFETWQSYLVKNPYFYLKTVD